MPPLRRDPFVLFDAMDGHDTRDLAARIEKLSPQEDSGNAIFIAALLDGELQRLLLTFMPTISNILLRDFSMTTGRSQLRGED